MLKLVLGGSGSGKTTLLYSRIKPGPNRAGAASFWCRNSSLPARRAASTGSWAMLFPAWWKAFPLPVWPSASSLPRAARRCRPFRTRAAPCWCAARWKSCRIMCTTTTATAAVAAFCQMAAQTIDELKSAGLSGAQLAELAPDCGPESGKLSELALIFQGYETLLAGTGMDPADRLELAADRLEAALARGELPDFLREREVFIDEFDTFNAPKKRLMGAMLAALPTVTVALCDDGAPMVPGDMGLFPAQSRWPHSCGSWPAKTVLMRQCRSCCAATCAIRMRPALRL